MGAQLILVHEVCETSLLPSVLLPADDINCYEFFLIVLVISLLSPERATQRMEGY